VFDPCNGLCVVGYSLSIRGSSELFFAAPVFDAAVVERELPERRFFNNPDLSAVFFDGIEYCSGSPRGAGRIIRYPTISEPAFLRVFLLSLELFS
jgi:hypothetical protein